jgi:HK97 family phage major capsid protein
MSRKLIEKLRSDRDAARATVDTLLAKVEQGTDLSEGENQNLTDAQAEATALDARIKSLTESEMARLDADALDAKFNGRVSERSTLDDESDNGATTLGEQFVASASFDKFREAPAGTSALFTVEGPLSSFAVAGAAVSTGVSVKQRTADRAIPALITPFLDIVSREPVSGNSLEWLQWPADPAATVVGENVTKSVGTYQPTLATGTLDKIAVSVPFTREIMEDVPRFQAMLDGALMRSLGRKMNTDAVAALVAANGNMIPVSSATLSLMEVIREGIAVVQSAGWQNTAIVLNPLDYAKMDIELLASTLLGARRDSSIWGVPVVADGAVAVGDAYVGDFTEAVTLFDRQTTALYLTDSHASEFLDNVLRALAEARQKTVVVQPAALAHCTTTAPGE